MLSWKDLQLTPQVVWTSGMTVKDTDRYSDSGCQSSGGPLTGGNSDIAMSRMPWLAYVDSHFDGRIDRVRE